VTVRPTTRAADVAAAPVRSVVYLCPGVRCDIVPFAFYADAPAGYLLDQRHVTVDGYDPGQGRELLALAADLPGLDPGFVARVVLGGSAFSLGFTWDELIAATTEASRRAGVPVVTDMMSVVSAMRAAGVRRVTVAHRLAGVRDDSIGNFLRSAGITCSGVVSAAQDIAANASTSFLQGASDARELAMEAALVDPDVDAVLLLGGTWWVGPARDSVRAAGKHFFNNLTATALDLPVVTAPAAAARPARPEMSEVARP
jgi:hypothetical protein